MNNPVVIQILGVLLVLFFFFVAYMCSKTWRITHVIFAFLTFGGALALLAFAALSLKTRATWQSQATRLEEQLETLEEEGTRLLHGELKEVRQQQESLRTVRGKWKRTMLDRGRVWRNANPGQVNNNQIQVSTVPPGLTEADAPPNRIAEGELLYVFRETEWNGIKVPTIYLGEFYVAAASDTSVTLEPSIHLGQVDDAERQSAFSKYQVQLLKNNNNATWALYETTPIDSHAAFAVDPTSRPDIKAPGSPAFGQMDEDAIQEIFQMVAQQAEAFGLNLPPDFPEAIQQYVRDGNRSRPEDNDPPETVYTKIRFLKPHSEEVDTAEAQGAIAGQFFDPFGRAQVKRLQRGEPAEFQIDEVGVFEQQKAQELIDAGIAEAIEPVYVRPLNDYAYSFHSIFAHLNDLRTKIVKVQRETDAVNSSLTQLNDKITYHQQERTKLEEDLEKHQYEAAEITKLSERLRQQKQQLQREMSAMYQVNIQLAQQLAYIHQQIQEKVDREEAQATASVGGE